MSTVRMLDAWLQRQQTRSVSSWQQHDVYVTTPLLQGHLQVTPWICMAFRTCKALCLK